MRDIDPIDWEALDEDERIHLVVDYHEELGVDLPDMHMHALLHVVVENQIAFGDQAPAASKLTQLRHEGLDRHEAIHAIASVVVNHLYEGMHGSEGKRDNDDYWADLESLTAERWLETDSDDRDEK